MSVVSNELRSLNTVTINQHCLLSFTDNPENIIRQTYSLVGSESRGNQSSGCTCQRYRCGCCQKLDIETIKLHEYGSCI